jgi:hypothetical protein
MIENIPAETTLKYTFRLINKSACKKACLEYAKQHRPANNFTRVGEEFLISCENALKAHILSRVRSHPSIGKTLK